MHSLYPGHSDTEYGFNIKANVFFIYLHSIWFSILLTSALLAYSLNDIRVYTRFQKID